MNSKFKITIPKPCHENWNAMTPKKKGKFCSSCSKTVIDFTKKSTEEIQDYLIENKNQRVCGHFNREQLDDIVIEIPQIAFQQKLSFQKAFILALFFAMGTTLFSCKYSDGKKQKIENIIIKDSVKIDKEDVGLIFSKLDDNDSTVTKKETPISYNYKNIPPLITTGIIICPTIPKKEVAIKGKNKAINPTDTIEEIPIEIKGDITYEAEEDIDDIVVGLLIIEETPRFKEAKNLSKKEAKAYFDEKMLNFFKDNFDESLTSNLSLKAGKYKILTQFIIDENGFATKIKVRAPHPKLIKEVKNIFLKLPQFLPGKQKNKVVKTRYTLPISLIVD
ncbi:MAG: hypothetical protein WAO74_08225 [Polaribacter sp.]|uniref:hypothetical protein n=1 Tax=Polaribacter sp. TaxID=1920175 RepID=UPI003BAF0380